SGKLRRLGARTAARPFGGSRVCPYPEGMGSDCAEDTKARIRLLAGADIRTHANESLARQSVAGVYGNLLLALIVLSTTSLVRSHPIGTAVGALWIGIVGIARLAVARSWSTLRATRPAHWVRVYRAGHLLSSATWGLGGAILL